MAGELNPYKKEAAAAARTSANLAAAVRTSEREKKRLKRTCKKVYLSQAFLRVNPGFQMPPGTGFVWDEDAYVADTDVVLVHTMAGIDRVLDEPGAGGPTMPPHACAAAIVFGKRIATKERLMDTSLPSIKYKKAYLTQCGFFLDPGFKAANKGWTKMLENACGEVGSKWTLLCAVSFASWQGKANLKNKCQKIGNLTQLQRIWKQLKLVDVLNSDVSLRVK